MNSLIFQRRIIICLALFLFSCFHTGCLASGWTRAILSANNQTKIIKGNRIAKAKSLPPWGKGFTTYSWLGSGIGRQYAHHKVIDTLISSFEKLSQQNEVVYVVAEIGWKDGRKLSFHASHKMGLKVDILTPVKDTETGKPKQLPSSIFNLWGYCWSFNAKTHRVEGKKWEILPQYISSSRWRKIAKKKRCPTTKQDLHLEVDFKAIQALILMLKKEAPKHGLRLSSVIIDESYIPKVGKTGVKLSPRAWIRHDEHLHFSFVHHR